MCPPHILAKTQYWKVLVSSAPPHIRRAGGKWIQITLFNILSQFVSTGRRLGHLVITDTRQWWRYIQRKRQIQKNEVKYKTSLSASVRRRLGQLGSTHYSPTSWQVTNNFVQIYRLDYTILLGFECDYYWVLSFGQDTMSLQWNGGSGVWGFSSVMKSNHQQISQHF